MIKIKTMSWGVLLSAGLFAGAGLSGCLNGTHRGEVLFRDDFSDGDMAGWWAEGAAEVRVENGRLMIDADPLEAGQPEGVSTVWYNREFHGDLEISFDAHVLESEIDANNINFFFYYTYPEVGKTIWDTRVDRADGAYSKYHNLNGYIITFLNDFQKEAPTDADGTARIRMRRCPGFNLINETFAYHCNAGTTYHCRIVKQGGLIGFYIDGSKVLEAVDDNPLSGGLIGLRTFRTCLWWDNIVVRRL